MLEDAANYIKDAVESLRSSLSDIDLSLHADNKQSVYRKSKSTRTNGVNEASTSKATKAANATTEVDKAKMINEFAEMYSSLSFVSRDLTKNFDKTKP